MWLRNQVTALLNSINNNNTNNNNTTDNNTSVSAFVQTTEPLPYITSEDGPHSMYDIRNIEMVEQFLDRVPNANSFEISRIAAKHVLNEMSFLMLTRELLVYAKVGEYPIVNNIEVWQKWPIKKLFQAWRPCMTFNSSATEPLKLKDLLANVKVGCNFNRGHKVASMVSKILEKTSECPNPTAADHMEAIKLLLSKHKKLSGTDFDPKGTVYKQLENANLRNIGEYKQKMSAIAKRLESANFTMEEMGTHHHIRGSQEDTTP